MSAADDFLRLMGPSAAPRRSAASREDAGCRQLPRSSDWNAVFERAGLGDRLRRI